jgi:hypothetical protein
MDYEQFLKKTAEHVSVQKELEYDRFYSRTGKKNQRGSFLVSEKWITGGASGGNCWGDDATPIYFSEKENPLTDLNKLLSELTPNISFLKYKTIEPLIKIHNWHESEYYGNYYDYAVKYIDLADLFKEIQDLL